MKIAFVTFEYPPFIIGGAGSYAKNITEELVKLGHKVTVFTPAAHDLNTVVDVIQKNLKIVRIDINRKMPFVAPQFWLRLPKVVKKEHAKEHFDLIHFNGLSYWFFNNKKLLNIPHILTVHHTVKDAIHYNDLSLISRIKDISGENSLLMPIIEKKSLKTVDAIISDSEFTKNQIIEHYNVRSDKINVIYIGINSNGRVFKEEELNQTKKMFSLPNDPVILFVGRVDDPRKGIEIAFKAISMVLEKFDTTLLVVGSGNQKDAKNMVETLEISDKVVFTGFVEEETLKKCFDLCDVYVCPSKLEGFGLTILDAMTVGKPIVASETGSIPEILEGYDSKILFETGNVESLTVSLITVLEKLDLYPKNYKFDCTKFSWSMSAESLSEVYNSVLKK